MGSQQQTNAICVDPESFNVFDYVIVGGGTAGLACASRLSAEVNTTVGVLEAGAWRPDDPKINVPAMMGQALMDPEYDWCFDTVPQTSAHHRRFPMPRGRVLGGSSALNFLCWQRGWKRDFDDMAALGGNEGWDWDSLTDVYKKLTRIDPHAELTDVQKSNNAGLDRSCHGTQGAVTLSHSSWYCSAQNSWWKMMKRCFGLADVQDGSGSGQIHGLWNSLASIDPISSLRVYAGTAFFSSKKRQNLTVMTNGQACRIDIRTQESGSQRACGVEFVHNGKTYSVKARKEVVLCAGTYLSPKLLELSGVGDPAILEKHQIDVKVANKNVGNNLQEHVFVSSVYEVDENTVTFDKLLNARFAQRAMTFLGKDRQEDEAGGIMGSPIATAFAYSSLHDFLSEEKISDLQQLSGREKVLDWTEGMKKGRSMQVTKIFQTKSPTMEFSMLPMFFSTKGKGKVGSAYVSPITYLQYPLSRGTVHIRSSDPFEPPAIDPRFFSDPTDLRSLAYALQRSAECIEQDSDLSVLFLRRHTPANDVRTIEDWEEYVRQYAGATYHPVGTCSMMASELGGVVDSQLRVYGVEGLRVADASVIPLMPSGHIQSACYIIGYRAADLLKESMAT